MGVASTVGPRSGRARVKLSPLRTCWRPATSRPDQPLDSMTEDGVGIIEK